MEYLDSCSITGRCVARKVGLYNLEMISPQGCNFQMGGLAYDKMLTRSITVEICFLDR